MHVPQATAIASPLADCAHWAVRDLAAKLAQPCVNSSEIVNQIGFAARALRAYQDEIEGQVPADFLRDAFGAERSESPLESTIEQLLVSVSIVTAADQDGNCPADKNVVSNKLGDWLASVCLRMSLAS